MAQKPDSVVDLSPTLRLASYAVGGAKGYWLWDATREMNLAMRSDSVQSALLQAIKYYQQRSIDLENELNTLRRKVDSFLVQFDNQED